MTTGIRMGFWVWLYICWMGLLPFASGSIAMTHFRFFAFDNSNFYGFLPRVETGDAAVDRNLTFTCHSPCQLPDGLTVSESSGLIQGKLTNYFADNNLNLTTVVAIDVTVDALYEDAPLGEVYSAELEIYSNQDCSGEYNFVSPTLVKDELFSYTPSVPRCILEALEADQVVSVEKDPEDDNSVPWRPPPTRRREFVSRAKRADVLASAFRLQGTLPPGLSFDVLDGTISGRPLQAGSFGNFSIYVIGLAQDHLVSFFTRINVNVSDCSVATYGPNNVDCGSSGFQGDNCELSSADASSTSSSQTDIGLAVGVAFGVSFVVLAALLAYYLLCLRSNKEEAVLLFQDYRPPPEDEWEYDRDELTFVGKLGEGNFGSVFKAQAVNIRGIQGVTHVAVKTCGHGSGNDGTASEIGIEIIDQMQRFAKEACAMKRFDHPHVLTLLGVCLQEAPLLLIAEIMPNGDLHKFLRTRYDISPRDMCMMARDVADGLSYLHSLKFIHGDVACRNCLVDADLTVKISDFGLGKDTSYKGYYSRSAQSMPLPVRWMSPECLRFGQYNEESDAWSMGVVINELFTHGEMPYPAMGNGEVLERVMSGYRMPQPGLASHEVYELMCALWDAVPRRRPSLKSAARQLEIIARQFPSAQGRRGGAAVSVSIVQGVEVVADADGIEDVDDGSDADDVQSSSWKDQSPHACFRPAVSSRPAPSRAASTLYEPVSAGVGVQPLYSQDGVHPPSKIDEQEAEQWHDEELPYVALEQQATLQSGSESQMLYSQQPTPFVARASADLDAGQGGSQTTGEANGVSRTAMASPNSYLEYERADLLPLARARRPRVQVVPGTDKHDTSSA